MTLARFHIALLLCLGLCAAGTPARALMLGQMDTFEDGTTDNWFAGLDDHPPNPPVNIPTGGPAGIDDNYLQITSQGGHGPGSKLTAINGTQWAGDYLSTGIGTVRMDLRNLGQTDLYIRLLFEDPIFGPPADVAITSNSFFLPAGAGWTSAWFGINPGNLIPIEGDVNTVLSNTTAFRIFHSQDPGYPGPAITAQLGVDNMQALAPGVPEPASWLLLASGIGAFGLALRMRRSR